MNKRDLFRSLLPCLLLVLLGTALPAARAQGPAKIEPALLDRLASSRSDLVVRFADQADLSPAYAMSWEERGRFVVAALQGTAARSQARAIASLDGQGLQHRTFLAGNELYVWAGDMEAAAALAALPEVAAVLAPRTYYVDPPLASGQAAAPTALDWGIADTRADQFWAAWGTQGAGIVVANLGTGVLWDHPALVGSYRCAADPGSAACWYDPSNVCGGLPCDNNGQSTHTTGTMVGDDDPALPHQVGMAPGATWIACKGCESSLCSTFALEACADWLLQPGGDPANRPHVVNSSWGGSGGNDWYLGKVQAWQAAGIFPAFTVGNAGPTCGTIGSPGDYQVSFATAAHDDSRTIGPFSGRGPSATFGHTPYTKPNISAPGVDIWSTYNDGGYIAFSGAGIATPHSAGAVALLWSCNPALVGQVDQTFRLLQDYAAAPPAGDCGEPGDGGNYTYGYGYLDVMAAGSTACLQPGTLAGHVYDLGGSPLAGATVTAEPGGVSATSAPDGSYAMALLPGTYAATAAAPDYGSQTVPGLTILPGQATWQDFALLPGSWIAMAATPFEYTRFDCAWYDDGTGSLWSYNLKVYCLGGRTSSATEDPSIWRYDPLAGTWSDTAGNLPEDVSNYTANLLYDEHGATWGPALYVVGGYDADAATPGPTNLVQRYYPQFNYADVVSTDPWPAQLAGLPISGMGCATVLDRIYCFGGWENVTAPYFSGETWEYDPQRPVTQRWQQIAAANLNPPRAYPQVAVQGNVIYAIGGDAAYVGSDLVPTGVVEALDVNNLAAGWVARPSMPVALSQGRAFGMDADTDRLPWSGWLYTAGGGDWPASSAEGLAYDVAAGNWYQSFPDLNFARRNHAGVFIPLCTPDPADPMPSLMVIGGRTTSDLPPYAVPEYLPLDWPCQAELPVCQPFPADRAAWDGPDGTPPDDPLRGSWGSTDLQVLNLASDGQPFRAEFIDPAGEVRYALSGYLPGGATQVYTPEPSLPPGFSGTVVLTTPVRAAMAVVHLEPPAEGGRNTVFPGVPDDLVGHTGYTPIDGCTRLHVHNMDAAYPAMLQAYLLDGNGVQIAYDTYPIPPLGTVTLDPAREHNLPRDWIGSAILDADRPIRVTANSGCGGYAAFTVSPYCADTVYAPYLPPHEPGWMTTTLIVQNPSDQPVAPTIYYPTGQTQTVFLPAWGTRASPSLLADGGWAEIRSGGTPLVVVVRMDSADPAQPGGDAYRALALAEASRAVALPALFNGFQGWQTWDRIWVMNVGTAPTPVRIRYSIPGDDALIWDTQMAYPGEVTRFLLPPLPAARAAAVAISEDPNQPIVALAGAVSGMPELQDGRITYPGTNFPFAYLPVSGASFSAAVAGALVTFDGAVGGGDPPITYAWDWGDGSTGAGQHALHMYGAPGTYTVVMTAANALSFYSATAVNSVTVVEWPIYSIYLPVVLRGFQP